MCKKLDDKIQTIYKTKTHVEVLKFLEQPDAKVIYERDCADNKDLYNEMMKDDNPDSQSKIEQEQEKQEQEKAQQEEENKEEEEQQQQEEEEENKEEEQQEQQEEENKVK